MLKKQSGVWVDDEPKKTKVAATTAAVGDNKGRKSDSRDKRDVKETGNDKDKDREKDREREREKDREKEKEREREKDDKNSSTAPPSKVCRITEHPLSLLLLSY